MGEYEQDVATLTETNCGGCPRLLKDEGVPNRFETAGWLEGDAGRQTLPCVPQQPEGPSDPVLLPSPQLMI